MNICRIPLLLAGTLLLGGCAGYQLDEQQLRDAAWLRGHQATLDAGGWLTVQVASVDDQRVGHAANDELPLLPGSHRLILHAELDSPALADCPCEADALTTASFSSSRRYDVDATLAGDAVVIRIEERETGVAIVSGLRATYQPKPPATPEYSDGY